jgi:hypothetical protein
MYEIYTCIFMQMQEKWHCYFNENSSDGYEYQTLNDYNPIINKLNDTDGKIVFQSDVKRFYEEGLKNVWHESILLKFCTKEKPIIEWWTQ